MSCAQHSACPKADTPARDHFLSADSRESSRISPMERCSPIDVLGGLTHGYKAVAA